MVAVTPPYLGRMLYSADPGPQPGTASAARPRPPPERLIQQAYAPAAPDVLAAIWRTWPSWVTRVGARAVPAAPKISFALLSPDHACVPISFRSSAGTTPCLVSSPSWTRGEPQNPKRFTLRIASCRCWRPHPKWLAIATCSILPCSARQSWMRDERPVQLRPPPPPGLRI